MSLTGTGTGLDSGWIHGVARWPGNLFRQGFQGPSNLIQTQPNLT